MLYRANARTSSAAVHLAEIRPVLQQAARGAADDVSVRITSEDRSSGTLRGEQGASKVVITVITQADASIQVGFSVTGGGSPQDANLKEHLTRAYQRRMGR